jgi:hypothetical protein
VTRSVIVLWTVAMAGLPEEPVDAPALMSGDADRQQYKYSGDDTRHYDCETLPRTAALRIGSKGPKDTTCSPSTVRPAIGLCKKH